MTPSQIIVLATPVFFLLIAVEFAWGYAKGRNTYRLNDAINSISLGMLSQISAVFTRLFRVGIYTAIYSSVALFPDEAFWTTWYGWLIALVFYDFCYYWLHRAGHESAVFWAAHVVHHQSQDYNLSTALRQTSSGALLGWIFYVPMAIAGVPPLVFGVVVLIDLLYQFWVHTEHVPKLGWFDRWFCSPSNHRVHHAVNDNYVDKNYGGILIIWDRLFGSFREEDEKCVYGTRSPLNSWDPLWSNTEVYWALAKDSWHASNWGDKLRVWLKPPGWRPVDVTARFPKPPFDITRLERYHPPMSRALMWFGAVQFALLLLGVALFLWYADGLPALQSAVWLGALATGLWAVGAALQGRLTMTEVLLIEAAALATATSVLGLVELHRVFKPLALGFALVFVAARAYSIRAGGRFDMYLLAGLAFSLAGDCFLMFQGFFIPGLLSFLVAHLFYIVLFKQGQAWFPSRRALAATLGVGALMYAVLFDGLSPVLRFAVAAYVIVIALMAAQASGRATVLRDKASLGVAVGAGFFMLSDALLATNKFAQPLPMAQLWVLGTYYIAQILIVHHARPATAEQRAS
ncbi:MAG: lysoplasmalogenase family protein [Polaromonas sp.]|uniref:lysoplasmalogenase family protein n=1 Tax=Polaromonas sp. TaxID=1869339 RepID=UPI00272FEB78|nr:lysoplasmalogenase family protein [Polaromonas sp.]MDP2449316.1 lysoplasmalogenase family protein [Polaromonas sp.]MDP3245489.1 lysoplasmalogenase family protein [Polaromonas sp.]MDP3754667.1 lysoplasmalogenase family protein [Polaromonas sp.]